MNVLMMASDMVEEMNANVDRHLEKVIANEGLDFEEYKKAFNKHYQVEMCKKYLKVWYLSAGSKSIVMFVDETGNIFKPASHKSPAKGVRGNISNWKEAVSLDINDTIISFK